MTREEMLKNLMADQEFVKAIAYMEEPEDVQKAFSDKGVEITLEEINAIAEAVMAGNSDELSDDQLDHVAGGAVIEIITVVASGVALFANVMSEVNKERKAKGKKTIW